MNQHFGGGHVKVKIILYGQGQLYRSKFIVALCSVSQTHLVQRYYWKKCKVLESNKAGAKIRTRVHKETKNEDQAQDQTYELQLID